MPDVPPATYVLIHGGGDSASAWDYVGAELRRRGHGAVAVDLPIDDPEAGLWDYAETVARAAEGRPDPIVVGHSWGGFVAPLVCELLPARMLVLVAGVVPAPGETPAEWWEATGHADAVRGATHDGSDEAVFFHDVPADRIEHALRGERPHSEASSREPWPLPRWPDVPTRYLLCRDDRMFPAAWVRELVERRLGIAADEIDGGHCPYLSRPEELVDRLIAYRPL